MWRLHSWGLLDFKATSTAVRRCRPAPGPVPVARSRPASENRRAEVMRELILRWRWCPLREVFPALIGSAPVDAKRALGVVEMAAEQALAAAVAAKRLELELAHGVGQRAVDSPRARRAHYRVALGASGRGVAVVRAAVQVAAAAGRVSADEAVRRRGQRGRGDDVSVRRQRSRIARVDAARPRARRGDARGPVQLAFGHGEAPRRHPTPSKCETSGACVPRESQQRRLGREGCRRRRRSSRRSRASGRSRRSSTSRVGRCESAAPDVHRARARAPVV